MITGEERRYVVDSDNPSTHMAMTVEMVPVDTFVEVAVIDEIQMLRDQSRGWAWTRALLGVAAEEVGGKEDVANFWQGTKYVEIVCWGCY